MTWPLPWAACVATRTALNSPSTFGCASRDSYGAPVRSTRSRTRAPHGHPNRRSGWASCTPMAAEPGPPSYRPRPVIDKEADGGHLILLPIGGGGSERQWDGDFWVHPLPPNGPVTFVASWLLYEVAETHAELDSSAIYDAAQRADILWP